MIKLGPSVANVVVRKGDSINNMKGGIQCRYIKLSDDIGIKCYRQKYLRDLYFDRQTLAEKHGLGPKCFKKFQIAGFFCYVTENVSVAAHDSRWYENCDHNAFYEISRKLYAISIEMCDIHENNFGYTKEGKLVCIDFGTFDENIEQEYRWEEY